MKKALLACSIILSSAFFLYAQSDSGGVQIQVGRVCGTIGGKPMCINPTTGQWEISDGRGGGIGGNVNTGTVGGSGTIGGVRVGGAFNTGGSGSGSGAGGVAGAQNYSGVLGLLALAQTIVARLVPFLIGLALLAFFWYLITFIWQGSSNPDKQKEGKTGMFYSVLAIFVMVSIWGLIAFIGGVLGINQGGTMTGFNLPGSQ